MSPHKRYLSQVLLWLGIWLIVWVSMGFEPQFVRANGPSFLLQSVLLVGIIYYVIPKLLFKNKLLVFLLVIALSVLFMAYLGMEFGPQRVGPQGPPRADRAPPFLNSRFFRQLLIMSFAAVAAVMVEMFVLAQEKQRSEALAKAELKESELKFLKMQINPHFLFNALNNIYALSVTNSDKTQEGISTLSQMLRYVLYDCEQPQIALLKEVEYIEHFIELFKLKSSKAYNVVFEKEVDDSTYLVAPMLFVPFIENAFKHSGIEKRGDSFVRVELTANGDKVDFLVENSLPDQPLVKDDRGGIGISNIKKRLLLLYPTTHQLSIEQSTSFCVHLKLDLR